jgi:hypothetical protein
MFSETISLQNWYNIHAFSGGDCLMFTYTHNAAGLPQTLQSMELDQGLGRSQVALENSKL